MRLSLRFVLPLILVLAGIAYAITPLVDKLTLSWFVRDLDIRSTLIANAIEEPLQEQLAAGKKSQGQRFFQSHYPGRAPVCDRLLQFDARQAAGQPFPAA